MKKFCLYRHYDKDGKLLYIGKSNSFFQRFSQHKANSFWFEQIYNVTIDHFEIVFDLDYAERKAIEEEKPLYNLYLKSLKIKVLPKISSIFPLCKESQILYFLRLNIEKIEFELKRLGWTRTVLAQKMGISRQKLSYVLSHSYPKLEVLERLAVTIQVPARDLLE